TRKGALPPSSIDTRRTCSADCAISLLPTSVEPVKLSLRSRKSLSSGFETAPELELVIKLRTPPGRPASSRIWVTASALNGVALAGFRIMVQPAATAGAILRVAIAVGKFQGVMK